MIHRCQRQQPKRLMPKKPKNKSWISLTKGFVKGWPEVLEGLSFTNMPVKYLIYVNILLKNNITIHYDVQKELKIKKHDRIASFLKNTIEKNYFKIKTVDLKFNIPLLKQDIESKTSSILDKTFK